MASLVNNNKRNYSPSSSSDGTCIWDFDAAQFASWVRSLPAFSSQDPTVSSSTLLSNLVKSVTPLLLPTKNGEPPAAKRVKLDSTTTTSTARQDPYHVWIGQTEDIPDTFGAICVQLTWKGLWNALTAAATTTTKNNDATTLKQLTTALHRAIQSKLQVDVLETTPERIRELLCRNDVSKSELANIRTRVRDTVVYNKGLHVQQTELREEDAPVTARPSVSNVEKFKKCKVCGNNDQSLFVLDKKNGDVICTECGTVNMESVMHEGSQYRKFEGEVDRNHHGDAGNALYSNAHNMSTTLGGMNVVPSSVNQAYGTASKGLENILRNAHAYTELNLSQFGKQAGERRTRVGYKDRQKRDAFHQMQHVGDALNLHEAVVERAKVLFAGFRDDRELVQQFKGVIAACLCEAFDELSQDGHALLKQREQDVDAFLATSKRASRRNELHHANMAGKGGLLLDMSHVPGADGENGNGENDKKPAAASPKAMAAVEKKPAPTWDLFDCRSFLLEASRNIAQQWVKDRNDPTSKTKIPEGSQDELEGKLVEHTMTLCDLLEAEVKARNQPKVGGGGGNKVKTPRVQDMAQLGIKYQHKHERGSGGKGGVGGSGRQAPTSASSNGRTAGQILILKTSKKLGSMLKDPVAGEAFHKELRALKERQEAKKRKDMADEATRQRLQQMKRKPWLQAKAESSK